MLEPITRTRIVRPIKVLKKNDEVVFYLAGTGENSQSFVASAKISCVEIFNKTEVIDPDNKNLTEARIYLVDSVRIVLRNGLNVLGVSAPEKM